MSIYEWMKSELAAWDKKYCETDRDDPKRSFRRRMSVAWNYACIELDLQDGEPEDLGPTDVRAIIGRWRSHTEGREDLTLNEGNRELRECMLKVAESILDYIS